MSLFLYSSSVFKKNFQPVFHTFATLKEGMSENADPVSLVLTHLVMNERLNNKQTACKTDVNCQVRRW